MVKFVSFVEKRKIIIRDTRRFHHFADGLCSCGDYIILWRLLHMLSSIYTKAGRWKDFSIVRALMKEKGLVRTASCSYIEHGHMIHRFLVNDQAHPEIIKKIQKAGYVPNLKFILNDVKKEVKESLVSKHSENLAIAFGLLVYNDSKPLIITKNLRICGDCHNMAKFVSFVEKCKIIIRDTRRFHHFVDGFWTWQWKKAFIYLKEDGSAAAAACDLLRQQF
ncbi:hypothetical protein Ccrd_013532 [Cynara cardunculus var. scolymus]|uniref:DYW domain-containing protein n=1 Tax=Cynara cardunculus var. scolymus TaxID=59895 RepID=A0A103YFE5_CYNCS|nr:hypothetical protein Ccrd_013532 [Cynara cardunculus var. scolymus]